MNFGERMARLRKSRKRKGGGRKRKATKRGRVPKLAKKVARSAAAAKRHHKAGRTPKRAKAHKVKARNVGGRLRSLEQRMDRTEKNVAGIAVWARGMEGAVRRIYGLTGHNLGGGAHRGLPSGR